MAQSKRPGAVRKKKKGPVVGSGGQRRKGLEGRGPTPKAEDRVYHKAHRAKQSAARKQQGQHQRPARAGKGPIKEDLVTGRNSVLEALRSGVPAKTLLVASKIEMDDRVKDIVQICAERHVPTLEASRPELDRLTSDAVHQGVVLQVPAYEYRDAEDLAAGVARRGPDRGAAHAPLLVALDGITDPRNLGAIIRSVSAFSGDGVILPERRSAGVSATAWKTSAGAAARVPVAKATNLTRVLEHCKKLGYFVVGLDGGGDVSLPRLELASEPLVVVVGSEGKGLSRLVREHCDAIVSIPIDSAMESLNASMAVGIALYEISRRRASA